MLRRDSRPGVGDHELELRRAAAAATQHHAPAGGVAQGVAEQVLQHAAQQAPVAEHPGRAGMDLQLQAARGGQRRELLRHRLEQLPGRERRDLGAHRAGIQARDVEQAVEQFLGGAQRDVDALGQLADLAVQPGTRAQRRAEQARGVERLQQVMARGRDEAGLGLVRRLGFVLGLALGLERGAQFLRAGLDPCLQFLGQLAQRGLDPLVVRHVGVRGDEAAAGHRFPAHLQHAAIAALALEGVGRRAGEVADALGHVRLGIARSPFAAAGVPADQLGHRAAHAHHALGIAEQLEVAAVPRHQAQLGIDHRDALGHVLQGRLQQLAVEAQLLRGLVQHGGDLVHLHAGAAQRGGQHQACRGRADRAGERAFDVQRELAIGGIGAAQAAPAELVELGQRGIGGAFADDARGQRQQVGHGGASGQRRVVGHRQRAALGRG